MLMDDSRSLNLGGGVHTYVSVAWGGVILLYLDKINLKSEDGGE